MKIYKSIDVLPIYNYAKIQETCDVRYLLILPDYFDLPKIEHDLCNELFTIWENIQYQIIDFFGISEAMRSIMRMEKEIAILKGEKIITEDKSLETLISIKEKELQMAMPTSNANIEDIVSEIEISIKMQIDIYKTSVKKYLSYLKILQNGKN